MQTENGQTDISPDQAGFVPVHGKERPRLLTRIPGFYRPGPHEALIEKKHEEIQRFIEQRREERRRIIRERRADRDEERARLKTRREANETAVDERRAEAPVRRQEAEQRR